MDTPTVASTWEKPLNPPQRIPESADVVIIGAGIVGTNAGELIAEAAHAIEMGSDAADIGLTVHAHPTLSETFFDAAQMLSK